MSFFDDTKNFGLLAMVIALIILYAGMVSLKESIAKIIEPQTPDYSVASLVIVSVAIVVKLVLGRYVKHKGEQLKSDALIASGSDALFDAAITLATLVSAGVMLLWQVSLDGILGVLISAVIIKAGIEMLASPVNELLGARVSAELVRDIKHEVMAFDGVHGVYDIILHNYGPDVMIGSLHINVDDTMTAHDIHGLTRKISTQLYVQHGIIATVGVYAVATGDNKQTLLQQKVMQTLAAHKDIVQVHGFYISEADKMLSVDVVPDISVHDDAALVGQLTTEIQPLAPEMQIVIVVDHNYSE